LAGAIYNVVAGGCYLLALMLMCFTPKPKPLLRKMCCRGKDADGDGSGRRKGDDDVAADSFDEQESAAQPENEYEPYDPEKQYDRAAYTDTSPSSGSPHYASPY
jgi:hypothetical protein